MGDVSTIEGIACRVANLAVRDAIKAVIDRIRIASPADLELIRSTVRSIEPLTPAEILDGTRGEWKEEQPRGDDLSTWGWGFDTPPPGRLFLADEDAPDLLGIVAHELGHAVTLADELRDRSGLGDEWASELTADWHAWRWGFGAEIDALRASRDRVHHGFAPGSIVTVESDGVPYQFEIGADYIVRLLPSTPKAERSARPGRM